MSVVGMRRSGRQNQKEQRFGSLALVSSALLVLDVFWQQSRDLSLFCLCANRYKMLIFLRLQTHVLCISLACERRFVWFRGKEIFNPEKVGSDVAGVSAGLLSGANAVPLPSSQPGGVIPWLYPFSPWLILSACG